jgi:uncharacterized low-complexity protein
MEKKILITSAVAAMTFSAMSSFSAHAVGLEINKLGSGAEVRSKILANNDKVPDSQQVEEMKGKEGKCGEGKCGEKKNKGKEGKCGKKKAKGKEGKCGEGKCGEGKCGEEKTDKTEE